ncbi:cilia- and flagella-associated protein 263 isoform X2 [Hoplias malabaricus]|uniref:cilia- and flagella-associated protein 263 isoform X2 n=1 Tax=Hoplias malabaricus TaxID=27720 RepID=UPI00346312FC
MRTPFSWYSVVKDVLLSLVNMAEKKTLTEEDMRIVTQQVEGLRCITAGLRAENEMFERFMCLNSKGHCWSSKGQGPPRCITLEDKVYIGETVVEAMQNDLEMLRKASRNAVNNYKATVEAAEISLAEIREAKFRFDCEIAKPLQENQGAGISSEIITCHMENRIKSKGALIEKLHLQNAALRAKERKLQQKEKEEEDLSEAVFLEAMVHKRQFLDCLKVRNQELRQLMRVERKTMATLDCYKKELQVQTLESSKVNTECASHKMMLVKMEEDIQQAEKERAKAQAENLQLRRQLAEGRAPQVMDYVNVTTRKEEVVEQVEAWEHKVHLKECIQ